MSHQSLLTTLSITILSLSISACNSEVKGGSFLCASNFCARYRNSSRYPQEFDLAATHVGFRTVLRTQS